MFEKYTLGLQVLREHQWGLLLTRNHSRIATKPKQKRYNLRVLKIAGDVERRPSTRVRNVYRGAAVQ
jgi:hypothetical protein